MNPIYDTYVSPVPSIASSVQQRDTSISATTKAIDQLACQFMTKLNERATAFANGANFDLALRDAALMRVITPTSSLGYLKAGTIYQQQGRQQQAASMYEKGLAMVPSSDECYADLQKGHADAESAANNRVDFITQLPLEIVVSAILPLLFDECMEADTPCPYLYVSRTWRQRMLACNNLSFYHEELHEGPPGHMRELKRFSHHVKTLSMESGWMDVLENSLSIFDTCKFPNLTKLTIKYYGYWAGDVTYALESVSQTVTDLSLHTEEHQTPDIHLAVVLDLCPRLVSLNLTAWDILDLNEQYPTLTHLTMNILCERLSHDTMINLLSHLPSLVLLDIFIFPETQFLTSLRQYCPHMKLLMCGGHHIFHHDNYNRHVEGLQKLCLGSIVDDDEPYDGNHLIPLLRDNHQSLEHIVLVGGITMDEGDLDSSLEFNRLEELEVDAYNDDLSILAIWIIRRSSHLHRVKICNHVGINDDDLYNALKGLKDLRMLSARTLGRHSTWFGNLLEYHVQLGQDSPLKELKVAMDDHVSTFSWMDAIAGLRSLQKLVISTVGIATPAAYFSIIARITKRCPSLSYLELDFGRNPAPEGFISQINDWSTLQCLHVHASSISARDIIRLLSFANLKNVIIVAPVEDYLIHLLRKHIPYVDQQPR
ncbi:hypothetical protein O0I10_006288 [Lichtheimia ornata]|uniref:F-box domain-containing protein n=1 Tax=Lichtheimia ornata TaxID=688661 RepID=A0AAD7V2S4_9FUNG|nr:uncharacterized protein O0I10_006288 [Lichtheimia ornata]KAJ8658017.1 hypothetical protein O0I10_006288 [Lichtheimia ornata]